MTSPTSAMPPASSSFRARRRRTQAKARPVEADYTTRIVALTPIDVTEFNGTVLVEWLNVSGGIDAPAVWIMAHREIAREGYAYVAVSAQKVGVDGGHTITGIDMSLKKQDPERYSSLSHPGDAYAYDIFSQVGRLVRERVGRRVARSAEARNTLWRWGNRSRRCS